jgi:hypothetical protein
MLQEMVGSQSDLLEVVFVVVKHHKVVHIPKVMPALQLLFQEYIERMQRVA